MKTAEQIAEEIMTTEMDSGYDLTETIEAGDLTDPHIIVSLLIEAADEGRKTLPRVADFDGTEDAAEWLTPGHVLDAAEVEYIRNLRYLP